MIDVREGTAKMLEDDFQVDPQITETLFDFGFLDEAACRNKLIQRDFQTIPKHEPKVDAISRLSDKYCVSSSLVEKVIYSIY